MKKLLTLLIILTMLTIAHPVYGVNITVPSAPGTGYMLQSTSTGAYVATSTWPLYVGNITATSTATSTFQRISVTSAINLMGEYFTNFTTYVRSLFSATAPITLSAGGVIACNVASGSQPGCLSSADWTTFNNKQAAGNYITALTGDVSASGPGSVAATLATVNGNVGSFTNASLTVNGKGLITAASSGSAPEVPLTFSWPLIRTTNTISFGGLSTSTAAIIGNIPYFSGVNTFANIATTSVSCSGSTTCTSFTAIGAAPITISSTGGGTDPFTHPDAATFATTTAALSLPNNGFVGFMGNAVVDTSNYSLFGNTTLTLLNARSGGSIGFRIANSNVANFTTTGGFGFGSTYYNLDPGLNNMIIEGKLGVGSSTPGTLFSVGGNGTGTNFVDNATTTKSGVGGYNISQGCYAISGTCISGGSGSGTVTSVSGSGGTTGLTLTGGPITTSGTLTLGGTLAVANGGTGQINLTTGFSYASSTFTGTTTQFLGPAPFAQTFVSMQCETDVGTANVSIYDGTNRMNLVNASTTIGTYTFSTNNSFTAGESRRVDIGTPAASVSKIGCTVKYTQ